MLAVRVSIWVPDIVPGLMDGLTPAGRPEVVSETVPENPPTLVTVIVLVALPPCGTETAAGDGDKENPGAGFTVSVTCPVADVKSVVSFGVKVALRV